jgi:hypothetical protein
MLQEPTLLGTQDGETAMKLFAATCEPTDTSDVFNFIAARHNDALQVGVTQCNWLASQYFTATSAMLDGAFRRASCATAVALHLLELMDEVFSRIDPPRNQGELSNRGVLVRHIEERRMVTKSLQESLEDLYPIVFPAGEQLVKSKHQDYQLAYMGGYLGILDLPISSLL